MKTKLTLMFAFMLVFAMSFAIAAPAITVDIDTDNDGTYDEFDISDVTPPVIVNVPNGEWVKFRLNAQDPNGLGYPIFAPYNNINIYQVWGWDGGTPTHPLQSFAATPTAKFETTSTVEFFNVTVTSYNTLGEFTKEKVLIRVPNY